ncbi:Plasmodium vivax Vir protein, putative [Plasmodium ovale]|uniref:Plasmodium vivax Vir protein, putative n=1 Tax=Plasmodium ovale TaxID=36330 RepID=A0A1C3KGP1_PLAOA|nr:Plasmodium vivax Vir protein, putative [Plasmodium ovale]
MSNKKYNLGNSPTYRFENKLNDVIERCTFCASCDDVQHFYIDYGLKVLCYSFANNLEKIYYDFDKNVKLNDKRCNDLIYWWYNNLNYTYKKELTTNYQNIVNNFKDVWTNITKLPNISKDKLCKNYFEPSILSFQKCKNKKTVSDYCENYDFIQKELEKPGVTCASYYYYLTEKSNLYKNTVSKCHDNGDENCLSFSDCHNFDPEKLLKEEECRKMKQSETERDNWEELAGQSTMCHPGFACISEDIINTSITFSDYRFISLIVLSIWAIILSFFFLYKFSPFGYFINNILRKKNIIRKNIQEEEFHEFLESDTEDVPTNFHNRKYRITYNHD